LPEGHTVHRTANQFNELFSSKPIEISSPQGRFASGAALISSHKLLAAKAIGKQLFLNFDNDLTLRIHLGIYGKWAFSKLSDEGLPDPIGEVRARFANQDHFADLRGPTVCEVIGVDEVLTFEKRLGPDPLNPDPTGAEFERFAVRAAKTKAPIGQLLMNQEAISGIGNVYRAELLFRAGINPYRPANQLTREELDALWQDSVKLLKVGVKKGIMITRDELLTKNPTKSERNFVYKREGLNCRVCKTHVAIEIMAARKLYFCPSCQR
jgi:DNA-formamidopyrimidine glycosylase